MSYELQESSGGYLGVATPHAIERSEGDDSKLAAASLAVFLMERGIAYSDWTADDPTCMTAASDVIGVQADTGSDPNTFTIKDSGKDWTLCARILRSQQTDAPVLVLLVGMTTQMRNALITHGDALPQHAFLRMSDWVAQFNQRREYRR
ncbi:MAG: hypothetical protein H0U53_11005 [Actinobacteria bacterium]|nr:hypothetical protein [Actinomycetota bacterium]